MVFWKSFPCCIYIVEFGLHQLKMKIGNNGYVKRYIYIGRWRDDIIKGYTRTSAYMKSVQTKVEKSRKIEFFWVYS